MGKPSLSIYGVSIRDSLRGVESACRYLLSEKNVVASGIQGKYLHLGVMILINVVVLLLFMLHITAVSQSGLTAMLTESNWN